MGCAVRIADKAESIAALSADGVVERLKCKPGQIINGKPFLINDRMLLVLIEHDKKTVEAHIAQPKENWNYIHVDIKESLIFIQSLGYNQVYTNVRESLKTTLNLLKKHKFEQVDTIDGEVILKWASKQDYC